MLKISQSFSLRKAGDGISSLMIPFVTHLVMIKMHPNHEAVNQWKRDIASWLAQISNYANNVTPPGKVESQTLLKWMMPFARDYFIQDDENFVQLKYGKGSKVDYQEIRDGIEKIVPMILNRTPTREILNTLVS
jgi:glutaredoxin 2